jgi:hypothetical protein
LTLKRMAVECAPLEVRAPMMSLGMLFNSLIGQLVWVLVVGVYRKINFQR